jgi:shikimate kinase
MSRIVLVGYMGAGKSSLGSQLAKELGFRFIDSDAEIEKNTGSSISNIFSSRGETYFRELEKEWMEALFEKDNFVLATGGGLPCHNNMMTTIQRLGTSIYIKLSAEELYIRLIKERSHRPLIKDLSEEQLAEFINKSLAEREPFYLRSTHIFNGKEGIESLLTIVGVQS